MTHAYDELIKRLEAATGADREIDLAIHIAIDPDGEISGLMKYPRGLDVGEGMHWDIWRGGSVVFEKREADGRCNYNGGYPLPAYTADINAALTLVPEGWDAGELQWWKCEAGPRLAWVQLETVNGSDIATVEARGHTPALAIAIASLRARQSLPTRSGA